MESLEFLNYTLEISRSGDKFNAVAMATTAILRNLELEEGVKVHMSFLERGFLGEVSYTNFQLQPLFDEGKPSIRLESSANIKHFQSSEIPYLDLAALIEEEERTLRHRTETKDLRFLVWNNKELLCAVLVDGCSLDEKSMLWDWAEPLSNILAVSLMNLSNDFQLLLLKKQLEKQKQKILKDKDLIERQNQIFRSLMETMSEVHKSDLEGIFNYCLHQLLELFPEMGFGLTVDGDRPDIVQWAAFLGIPPEEQEQIIENHAQIPGPLSQKVLPELEDENMRWTILPMIGQERRSMGKLLIKGPEVDKHSREIITLFLEQLSAYTENQLLIRELERIANTDSLSGAYNRHYFNREHERLIQNARKFQNMHFSVFVIDLNGLKRVNDVYGHQKGDQMIVKAAELLMLSCRKSDMVCRFGGDEYVLLCPSTSMEQARSLLERVREQEEETVMICKDADGNREIVPVRLSVGIASTSEGISPTRILDTADQRMYADKEAYYADKERYR